MDEQLIKLKKNVSVAGILALIVFCWLVVDYYIIKTLMRDYNITVGFEIIFLSISLIIVLVFTITVAYILFKLWRFIRAFEKNKGNINS